MYHYLQGMVLLAEVVLAGGGNSSFVISFFLILPEKVLPLPLASLEELPHLFSYSHLCPAMEVN